VRPDFRVGPRRHGGVAAGLDVAHLLVVDKPSDYRGPPVIIGSDECSRAVMQLQGFLELGTAAFLLTRRPSLLQKRMVPEWVESAGAIKEGTTGHLFSPTP